MPQKKNARRVRKTSGPSKRTKFKNNPILFAVLATAVLITAVLVFISPESAKNLGKPANGSPFPSLGQTQCGEIKLSVERRTEASAYYRAEFLTAAGPDLKYEILSLNAIYTGAEEKLLTGYRFELIDNKDTISKPVSYSSISNIVDLDGRTIDFDCNEFPLGGARSPAVKQGSELNGCSIYRIPLANAPVKLNVYDLNGIVCTLAAK